MSSNLRSQASRMAWMIITAAIVLVWQGLSSVARAQEGEEEEAPTEVAVHVGKIVKATLHGFVVAYGAVELEPGSAERPPASAKLASPLSGIVSEVKCVEGQRVRKGDVLFQLDSRAADVAVQKAEQAVKFAEQTFERQEKLQKVEGTSAKLFDEAKQQLSAARADLEAAKTQRSLLDITAPLDGAVVHVQVKPGESVDLTTVLAEIMDTDRLVVSADVPNAEVPLLKLGQTVEIESDLPTTGSLFQAKSIVQGALSYMAIHSDPQKDTVGVRASLPAGSRLRPGQFVRMRVVCQERRDCLAVPEEALAADEDGRPAIAVVEGDKAVKKPVKTGLRERGLIEVEGEGLHEGQTIVTGGAYGLPAETKIRVIEP